jgi:hypothetical protein
MVVMLMLMIMIMGVMIGGVTVLMMRIVAIMRVRLLVPITFMVMKVRICRMMLVAMGMSVFFLAMTMIVRPAIMVVREGRLVVIQVCRFEDAALHAVAVAAAARIAMPRAAPVRTVLALFFGLAMGAFVRLDQRLSIGDRNLIIVGMDFAEGQKAVAVAAIFDEGGLQRRFYARDLREIDISTQLLALGGLEIKFFDSVAADHNDPGLFRVGGIDQHFVGHFGTLGGGGRVPRQARKARPGDATVHLIRG